MYRRAISSISRGSWPVSPLRDAVQLRQQLRDSLREALRARDAAAITALRSALSAIDNAEAVEDNSPRTPRLGVGAGDVQRRVLSAPELLEIIRREIRERVQAADQYATLGQSAAAERLRAEVAVLKTQLDDGTKGRVEPS